MARHITAWLGPLVEREIEDVIAWRTVVKSEPGVSRTDGTDRFSDDGANYRSVVVELEPLSKLQILQASLHHQRDMLSTHLLKVR